MESVMRSVASFRHAVRHAIPKESLWILSPYHEFTHRCAMLANSKTVICSLVGYVCLWHDNVACIGASIHHKHVQICGSGQLCLPYCSEMNRG